MHEPPPRGVPVGPYGRLGLRGYHGLRCYRGRLEDRDCLALHDWRPRFADCRWLPGHLDVRCLHEVHGCYGRLLAARVARVVHGNHADCGVRANARPLVRVQRSRDGVPGLHWRPCRVTSP